jgi:serine/threonine protein kinase
LVVTVGESIGGRYELEELVGSGGMSSVFKAHDTLLERNVALKILHEHHLDDEEYVERFRREARIVAQLSHPNIVTVIDRGQSDGRPFIVFEFVDGQTLNEMLSQRGALPIDEALEIAIAIARGLAFAHRHGLVHRDVKPQNILLNGDRQPKVTDFGIARSLDVKRSVTQTGTVLGTSNYIAPEQASGDRASAQSDIYSLGVVLFELLTGRVPFEGENFVTVAMKHINEPAPSVNEWRPDCPPRVAAAVARALAKDPRDRFPSMDALAAELEACLQELRPEDSTATVLRAPAGRPTRRPAAPRRARPQFTPGPALLGLLALAALAVIVVAAIAVKRDSSLIPGVGAKSPTKASNSAPIQVTASGAYDPPPGDGSEHNSDVSKATDGNELTYWTTERYGNPDFGGLKDGVGLVLDVGGAVKTLTVTSDTAGFTAIVKSGSSAESARPVSDSKVVGDKTTFALRDAVGPVLVLWITQLAPADVAHVNEVTATG